MTTIIICIISTTIIPIIPKTTIIIIKNHRGHIYAHLPEKAKIRFLFLTFFLLSGSSSSDEYTTISGTGEDVLSSSKCNFDSSSSFDSFPSFIDFFAFSLPSIRNNVVAV